MFKSDEGRNRNKVNSRNYYLRHAEKVKAKQAQYRAAHPRRKIARLDMLEHAKQLAAADPLNKFPVFRSDDHEANL